MDIRNRQALIQHSAASLNASAYCPKKLALIHTGAAVVLSVLLTAINYFLSHQISSTGGLTGISLRSVLSTAQTMLGFLSVVLMPFWELGFVFAAMQISRRKEVNFSCLFQGFRRFGPVLRFSILQGLLYLAIIFLCANISSAIFLMTPFAQPMAELFEQMATETITQTQLTTVLSDAMLPFYGIFGILFAVLAIPVFYRFRLAKYLIVDDPKIGAFAALSRSHLQMRRNRLALFRLDLHFWWFYGLQLLCSALAYTDILASMLGISLPISETAAGFLCYGLSCIGQLLLAWFFVSPVAVTYATAYDVLNKTQD